MTEITYLAAEDTGYRHPADEPPPMGTKLLILTEGNVCVVGTWDVGAGAIAWSPMPKISKELKARLEAERPARVAARRAAQ